MLLTGEKGTINAFCGQTSKANPTDTSLVTSHFLILYYLYLYTA